MGVLRGHRALMAADIGAVDDTLDSHELRLSPALPLEEKLVMGVMVVTMIVLVMVCAKCKRRPKHTVIQVLSKDNQDTTTNTNKNGDKVITSTTTTTKVVEMEGKSAEITSNNTLTVTMASKSNKGLTPVDPGQPTGSLPGAVDEPPPYKPIPLKEASPLDDVPAYVPIGIKEMDEEKPEEEDKIAELPKPYEPPVPKMNPRDRIKSEMASGRRRSSGGVRRMSVMSGAGGGFPAFDNA